MKAVDLKHYKPGKNAAFCFYSVCNLIFRSMYVTDATHSWWGYFPFLHLVQALPNNLSADFYISCCHKLSHAENIYIVQSTRPSHYHLCSNVNRRQETWGLIWLNFFFFSLKVVFSFGIGSLPTEVSAKLLCIKAELGLNV